ncbi:hypothetical protein BH11BAC4_BH11BAC4_16300 [soil metagenome]
MQENAGLCRKLQVWERLGTFGKVWEGLSSREDFTTYILDIKTPNKLLV